MTNSLYHKNILVIEPYTEGHHGFYLQWVVEGFVEFGFNVQVVTLHDSAIHPSLLHISTILSDHVDIFTLSKRNNANLTKVRSMAGLSRSEAAYWWLFHKWYLQQQSKSPLDYVFLPYLDYCLYAIGLFGSPFGNTPWAGIAMRPSFHYSETIIDISKSILRRLKKGIFMRLLRNSSLVQLLTIDETLFQYLNRHKIRKGIVSFLPQPTKIKCHHLNNISMNHNKNRSKSNRKIILLYGVISLRKGIKELLQAIAHPSFPKFVDIIIAGELEDEVRFLFSHDNIKLLLKSKRIILLDNYIPEDQEQFLFEIADIVWLGYRGHSTCSSVLIQAAKAGKPIIACQEGYIGWQAKYHNLGVAVQTSNINDIIRGVRKLIHNYDEYKINSKNGQRIFCGNNIEYTKNLIASIF